MNIFYLDHSPKIAAQFHIDTHTVKMCIESAQILSTAHRLLDGRKPKMANGDRPNLRPLPGESIRLLPSFMKGKPPRYYIADPVCYKETHVNHPSVKWVMESVENYNWVYELMIELDIERRYRYQRHTPSLSIQKHAIFLATPPQKIPQIPMTPVKVAMPLICRGPDPVIAYRRYYYAYKQHIAKWSRRNAPHWWSEEYFANLISQGL